MKPDGTRLEDRVPAYEISDAQMGPIFKFALGLLATTIVTVVLMRWLFQALELRRTEAEVPLHPLAAQHEVPPEPRLQSSPGLDNLAFKKRQEEALTTYGWIDRSSGIVRIPIERAIDLTLQKGLPSAQAQPKER